MSIISEDARKSISKTFYRIDFKTIFSLFIFSIVGVGLSFTGDYILKHHGTAKVRFGQVIISFLITGALYFLMESKNFNIKKLLFFLTILGGAIGFVMNDE